MVDSADDMAQQFGLDPKAFRRALRTEEFPWHERYARWNPPDGSPEHRDMVRVAERMVRQGRAGYR